MRILAIETSCDETSAAVVRDGTQVLSNIIASSLANFETTGGVIPEAAARAQLQCILPVIEQALTDARCTRDDIDAIAVTKGPGLLGSLLVGTMAARTVSLLWGKPLVGVHHTLGHLSSVFLDTDSPPLFPSLTISASGGHTELWYRTAHIEGQLLGRTRDDAAGEAFDKGAMLLGLPYPGGPAISRVAASGNPAAFTFPRPLHEEATLDFSFSGLKTALRYLLRDQGYLTEKGVMPDIPAGILADIAASYEHALCLHLCDRVELAISKYPLAKEVHLVGGVSANKRLRGLLAEAAHPLPVRLPTKFPYCTDNAAMIGAAAQALIDASGDAAYENFETEASLPLGEALRVA